MLQIEGPTTDKAWAQVAKTLSSDVLGVSPAPKATSLKEFTTSLKTFWDRKNLRYVRAAFWRQGELIIIIVKDVPSHLLILPILCLQMVKSHMIT